MRWFLTRSTTVLSVQAVLQLILESPWDVSSIIYFNEDVLRAYASSKAWSLSTLAVQLLSLIDVDIDVVRAPHAGLDEPASHRGRVLAGFGDSARLLPRIAQVWPGLPELVARRMQHCEVDNESFKELGRERFELETDRVGRSRPQADVLSWPTELVVAVLDEVLCGLPAHLWRTGQWSPGFDNELLWALLPSLEARIASHASLGPRPTMLLPTATQRSLGPIVCIAEDDPAYSGWIRLALHEVHYFRSDTRHWDAPNRRAEVVSGIVRTKLDGTVPASAGPFGSSDLWPWWEGFDNEEAQEDAGLPQLVKLFLIKDWLGQCIVLVPPLALRHQAKLLPSAFGAPLRWIDLNGKPAVVMRMWRLQGQGHHVESYSTQGCELLLRPDLEETLHTTFGGPLKELHQAHLEELAEASE